MGFAPPPPRPRKQVWGARTARGTRTRGGQGRGHDNSALFAKQEMLRLRVVVQAQGRLIRALKRRRGRAVRAARNEGAEALRRDDCSNSSRSGQMRCRDKGSSSRVGGAGDSATTGNNARQQEQEQRNRG